VNALQVALKADVLALERLVTAPIVAEGAGGPGGAPLGARLTLFTVAPNCLCVRPVLGTWAVYTPVTPLQVRGLGRTQRCVPRGWSAWALWPF
jgi:hypothetical protein